MFEPGSPGRIRTMRLGLFTDQPAGSSVAKRCRKNPKRSFDRFRLRDELRRGRSHPLQSADALRGPPRRPAVAKSFQGGNAVGINVASRGPGRAEELSLK